MEAQARRLRAEGKRAPGTHESLTHALDDVPGVAGGCIDENPHAQSVGGIPPLSIRVNVMVEMHADFAAICEVIREGVPAGIGLVGSYDDGHGGRFEPWVRMTSGGRL